MNLLKLDAFSLSSFNKPMQGVYMGIFQYRN
jgi:hypothetical protein